MSWFDEQIKQRQSREEEDFFEAMAKLSDTVTGQNTATEADKNAKTRSAVDVILRYYHAKPREIPERITDLEKQLEYVKECLEK